MAVSSQGGLQSVAYATRPADSFSFPNSHPALISGINLPAAFGALQPSMSASTTFLHPVCSLGIQA